MDTNSMLDQVIQNIVKETRRPIYAAPEFIIRPHIEKVIFHDPATIILWNDGTKTVVKCQPGDAFDKEKGFMAAYMKRMCGNDNTFNKIIKRWVDDE